MALLRKISSHAKTEINTGFGVNTADYGGRFLNKDGKANIEKRGVTILERISWYHSLLAMPSLKFFSVIFIFFITVNLLFSVIYFMIGVQHLGGVVSKSPLEDFIEAFFFSCQTFSTV